MPFEKKKKYKTAKYYKQKNIYLDENDQYQYECYKILELCGHKQSKFLGLLVHDYIQRMGINIEMLDKNSFRQLLGLLEVQVSGAMNGPLSHIGTIQPVVMQQVPYQQPGKIMQINQKTIDFKEYREDDNDDELIKEEDMDAMNNALAAFGV